jgi:hypothetical protein
VLTYAVSWRRIAARIRGLEKAAELHARFLASHSGSPYGADKALQRHCEEIRESIVGFHNAFEAVLPAEVVSAIQRFMADAGNQILGNDAGDALLVRTIVVKISAFESEVSFWLESPAEAIRSTSELAFAHLQRLIVADEQYRAKWQAAYADHETRCEQLGAVHLLWHGIWAFKVDAAGGKTDLVFEEPLVASSIPAALGFVLTEWKRASSKVDAAIAQARAQAAIYSRGILGGLELTSHRYLIVVTEKRAALPPDVVEDGITYRHINIAVRPETPSVASKRLPA